MNINRKRQLIRRKLKQEQARIQALCADETVHPWLKISQGVQIAIGHMEDTRRERLKPCDPMDVLDITQIGDDYPTEIKNISGTITALPGDIGGWNVKVLVPQN